MIALCRSKSCLKPGGEYEYIKGDERFPGYCTKKCAMVVARHHGWTEPREKNGGLTVLEVLKNAGLVGVVKKSKSTAIAVRSPEVQAVAIRFEEQTLTFSLTVPDDETLTLLVDPQLPLDEARQMELGSDADYKLMDMTRVHLLDEADQIEKARVTGTKPINAVKEGWDSQFTKSVRSRRTAASELANRMIKYDADKRQKAELEQREQNRLQLEEQNRLAEEARKLEEKAEKAKGSKAEDLRRTAHSIRRAAESMPINMATAAAVDTETAGSTKAELWKGEITEVHTALETLLTSLGPEWLDMINFGQGHLNNLAKMIKNSKELPGFRFYQATNLRRGKR